MRVVAPTSWSPGDYCLSASGEAPDRDFVETVYARVCRMDFAEPGFALVDLGPGGSSQRLRKFLLDLKRGLQGVHRTRFGRDLAFVALGRFDQQETTKPHRDGGPEESLLLLGYETSQVPAEVAMSDYAKLAHELGLSPGEFLERHNPMFASGQRLLEPYTTTVACFSNRHYQLLAINNSAAPYSGDSLQGVLHTATIRGANPNVRRVVNSAMVASGPLGTDEPISVAEQEEFVRSEVVRRRGYDKPELRDE